MPVKPPVIKTTGLLLISCNPRNVLLPYRQSMEVEPSGRGFKDRDQSPVLSLNAIWAPLAPAKKTL
jgi:hypothetical protein